MEQAAHQQNVKGRVFVLAIGLNLVYLVLEAVMGLWVGSLALLADAAHNLSDVVGLALAWAAVMLAGRQPTNRRTYGFGRVTILAALLSSLILLLTMGAMAWEAISRLDDPQDVPATTVIWVAAVGLVINALTAWLFVKESSHDLNIRGAFLHMAADAAVSAGVVLAAWLMLVTAWLWLDPVISILVAVLVVFATWGLLRDSAALLLDAVPPAMDTDEVASFLLSQHQVHSVHDLHIWAMSTRDTAMTAHLVVDSDHDHALLADLQDQLASRFGIGHMTIQMEPEDQDWVCPQASSHHQ
jgi:cobalt-zinc-cadmium efflux system protein